MSLGVCDLCRGALCISGRKVRCENCGHIHEDHPVTLANAVTEPPPPAHVIPPQEYASTIPDRLIAAEKAIHAMGNTIKAQDKRIKHLEKELGAVGGGR